MEHLRALEVPQPIGTQSPSRDAFDRTRGGDSIGRRDHLPAVAGADDASCAMQREGDVVAVAWIGDAGVQTHPHPDGGVHRPRLGAQPSLRVHGSGEGVGRRGEGDEQSVAFRLELSAPVIVPGRPQDAVVLVEQGLVAVAQAAEQPR